MAHEAVWRRTVPVLLAGLEEDAVTGLEHLDRATSPLGSADALEDVDRLAVRVGVPRRARAGREVDPYRARTGAARGRRDLVEEYRAGEPLARAATGLEAVPRDLQAVELCHQFRCQVPLGGTWHPWASADGLLDQRRDLLLVGRAQLRQRELGGPHRACVEVRLI